MGLIPEEIKAVERPDKTEVRLYKTFPKNKLYKQDINS